jgi:toxin ParE1/3/4
VKVSFTPAAKKEFLAALAYIREDNPPAASRFREQAEKVLSRLERFPESGRVIPEFPELPYREVVIPPYRFFYRLQGDSVWVVAEWHGAQLPQELQT